MVIHGPEPSEDSQARNNSGTGKYQSSFAWMMRDELEAPTHSKSTRCRPHRAPPQINLSHQNQPRGNMGTDGTFLNFQRPSVSGLFGAHSTAGRSTPLVGMTSCLLYAEPMTLTRPPAPPSSPATAATHTAEFRRSRSTALPAECRYEPGR